MSMSARTSQSTCQLMRQKQLKPNQALALLVGLVLEADAAERQRAGNRLERLGADRDAAKRLHSRLTF
jgi:hypothetical protein